MQHTNKSFIYPEIASLLEAKEEVKKLMDEAKYTESHITEREDLIVSELEAMSAKIYKMEKDAKRLKLFIYILSFLTLTSISFLIFSRFH